MVTTGGASLPVFLSRSEGLEMKRRGRSGADESLYGDMGNGKTVYATQIRASNLFGRDGGGFTGQFRQTL